MVEIKKGQTWRHKFGVTNKSQVELEINAKLNANCWEVRFLHNDSKETMTSQDLRETYVLKG